MLINGQFYNIEIFFLLQQYMKQKQCFSCKSQELDENQEGFKICTKCGAIQQSASFSNHVTFFDQKLNGQMVDLNTTAPSKFLHKTQNNTVEKRFQKAQQKINELQRLLNIQDDYNDAFDAAIRVIKYANDYHFFDKGKNMDNYSAAALYITLRIKQAPYLLIDFSDKLNVGLFKLARCFLKLARFLRLQQQLPLIDPSLFIHRYCRMLDFPTKSKEIGMTAIRLVQRMERDWMSHGRRPSSLCGAAILISAKIHDVRCSTSDICKTVYVCDETIRRRLEEFKQTKTAKLTRQQFEKMEGNLQSLPGQQDPPAFSKARMKSQNLKKYDQKHTSEELQRYEQFYQDLQSDKKQVWPEQRYNLNISNQVINHELEQIQLEMKESVNMIQNKRQQMIKQNSKKDISSYTDDLENSQCQLKRQRDYVLNEKQVLSQLSEQQVEKFILTQEEQKYKKIFWIQMNKKWLQKQQIKQENGIKTTKKRKKKEIDIPGTAQDAFSAIKNSKLGQNINQIELKKLLDDKPIKAQVPQVQVNQIFNAFAWRK